MSDKEIKINFKTSADTSGADDARESIKGVSDEVKKANSESKKGSSKSLVDKLLGGKSSGKLGKFKEYGKKLKDLTGNLKGVSKAGARIGGLYAIVTFVGNAFGGLLKKASAAGEGVEKFGDDMALTGTTGAGFIQWLGRSIKMLDGWGDAIKRTFNPIGAWIKSTRELAASQKQLERTMEELAISGRKKAAAGKKAADAANDERVSANKLAEATAEYIKANEAWEKSIEGVSSALEHQERLTKSFADAKRSQLDRGEDSALSKVDRQLQDGTITEEKAEKKRLDIKRKYATARERLERKVFDEAEKVRKKRIQAEQDIAAKSRSGEISLRGAKEGFLSDDQRKLIEEEIKGIKAQAAGARVIGASSFNESTREDQQKKAKEFDAKAQALQDKLSRSDQKKKAASALGLGSPEDVQKAIDDVVEKYKEAKRKIAELARSGQVSGINERSRREGAVHDFKELVVDGRQRVKKASESDEDRSRQKKEAQDQELLTLGKEALDIAKKRDAPIKGINELALAITRGGDGLSSPERSALMKLIGQLSGHIDRTQNEKSELEIRMKQIEKKLSNQKPAR